MVKRVTLGDVAKAAGDSTAPVSMALNRKPGSRIPTSTIDKVKAAAQELGYRPNSAARALKTGKTGVLGFISDEVTITRFASPMISGILEYAEQAGLSVMMAETAHKDVQLAKAIENLEGRIVDGLIVGLMASREIGLPETSTPIVVCNGKSHALLCVLADDFTAGHDAISYLAARAHSDRSDWAVSAGRATRCAMATTPATSWARGRSERSSFRRQSIAIGWMGEFAHPT